MITVIEELKKYETPFAELISLDTMASLLFVSGPDITYPEEQGGDYGDEDETQGPAL